MKLDYPVKEADLTSVRPASFKPHLVHTGGRVVNPRGCKSEASMWDPDRVEQRQCLKRFLPPHVVSTRVHEPVFVISAGRRFDLPSSAARIEQVPLIPHIAPLAAR